MKQDGNEEGYHLNCCLTRESFFIRRHRQENIEDVNATTMAGGILQGLRILKACAGARLPFSGTSKSCQR